MPPTSSNSVAQARLREALNAGGPGTKEKGPPVADGFLSVTPDTPEAIEFRSRQSVIDSGASTSSYLEDETGQQSTKFLCAILRLQGSHLQPACLTVLLCLQSIIFDWQGGQIIFVYNAQAQSHQSCMENLLGRLRTSQKLGRGN